MFLLTDTGAYIPINQIELISPFGESFKIRTKNGELHQCGEREIKQTYPVIPAAPGWKVINEQLSRECQDSIDLLNKAEYILGWQHGQYGGMEPITIESNAHVVNYLIISPFGEVIDPECSKWNSIEAYLSDTRLKANVG